MSRELFSSQLLVVESEMRTLKRKLEGGKRGGGMEWMGRVCERDKVCEMVQRWGRGGRRALDGGVGRVRN